MKITVSTIPDSGLEREASCGREWLFDMLPGRDTMPFLIDTVFVRCRASTVGTTVSLLLGVATNLQLECCRCLKEFILPVDSEFTCMMLPAEKQTDGEEVELTGDDLGLEYYRDDTIDVDPLILEQIVLQIPLKPVCAESCKGLCPRCGIDLNVDTCDHRGDEEKKNPFAVLKNLHIDNNKKKERG
jgi:uncharacterized protein